MKLILAFISNVIYSAMIYEAKTSYRQINDQTDKNCPTNLSKFALGGSCGLNLNSSGLNHGDSCELGCPKGFKPNSNIARPTCSCFTTYKSVLTLARPECVWLQDESQLQCIPNQEAGLCPTPDQIEHGCVLQNPRCWRRTSIIYK